jgi:predicted kinase
MGKKKLIVVCGLPGTGKTSLALALAREVDALHFNTDIIRHDLGLRGEYDAETKVTVYLEMLHQVDKAISEGNNVIVDGTFYKKTLRRPLQVMADEGVVNIYWVEVICAEEIVEKRISAKRAFSEADFVVHQKIRKEFEDFDEPHLILDSGTHDIEHLVAETMQYLQHDL